PRGNAAHAGQLPAPAARTAKLTARKLRDRRCGLDLSAPSHFAFRALSRHLVGTTSSVIEARRPPFATSVHSACTSPFAKAASKSGLARAWVILFDPHSPRPNLVQIRAPQGRTSF